MQKSLVTLLLVIICVGCHDRETERRLFDKKYADLSKIYVTGDIPSAEQALVSMENLATNQGREYFTTDGLPMEVAILRTRRAQIAETLGDHKRAQQLLGEALDFAHLAGKNTNTGSTGLVQFLEQIDGKRTIKWKQVTN